MPTAQDAFRAMVKDQLAPAFRDRGLRGSGARYELPSDTHWLLVGLQKSMGSTADAVHFVVNVSAVGKAAWTRHRVGRSFLGEKPTGNAQGPGTDMARLGVLAFGVDKWWVVRATEPATEVVREVLQTLDEFGMPWLAAAAGRDPS
jgi:hypothetical protein